ncbi:uncharacterized protein EDB93DRAFT_1302429 [Suillus bovinus]|uniref:uncharacterized protein n=1 Tax=Suillus bovinus TaxID=48563 RepID=UPI001B86E9AB|nr:uncharacterized protein EDB93DRAFT_1302429 [Suillus bovinus]KAG2137441.1 hypothetical protein EDB93DRAFT_1302429 [Suillus bovinus]
MDKALHTFHKEHHIFKDVGITPDGISLPRQHSLCHYRYLIQQFSTPNGLCSSLTESKHCKAVKEPWRHSSGYLPLGQMLGKINIWEITVCFTHFLVHQD